MKEQWVVNIHVVYEKLPISGWQDNRRTVNAHTLYWIHSGRGTFHAAEEHAVEGGMLVYLKPGLELWMKSDEADPLHITMVIMDCAELTYEDGRWVGLTPLAAMPLPFLSSFSPVEVKRVDRLFRTVLRYSTMGNALDEARSRAVVTELLHELKERGGLAEPGATYDAYKLVKAYMEQHYDQPLKIKELCERFGISESFFRKLFVKYNGCSPKQHMTQIRYEQATRLLTYTHEPLRTIAEACGFADEYHFSKRFKQKYGVAPSVYRGNRVGMSEKS